MEMPDKRRLRQQLEYACLQIQNRVQEAIALVDGVPLGKVWFRPNAGDAVRLLNLQVWELRYQVDLNFILQTLLGYYHRHRRLSKAYNKTSLGIPVAVLCGDMSQQVLEEAILRAFPEQENRKALRSDLQNQISGRTQVFKLNEDDPEKFVSSYSRKIQRAKAEGPIVKPPFIRRTWRGNPWGEA